ncbi:Coatomer beta subunit [Trema orientale]|uniref:Coatomer beta subunit n=1 Tax=Trema orientale TaxID=63057 RepID=A0A2P5F5I5_TREOI|nr:Coatomer beta subunit [Trema orientale]
MEVAAQGQTQNQISQLLNETLSSDCAVVRAATEALDGHSLLPGFPFYLLSIITTEEEEEEEEGERNKGRKIAAATYLKNLTRRNIDKGVSKEFKDELLRALLLVEPSLLRVLIEVFRIIVSADVVKHNSWPQLVPDLRSAIQNSNLISNAAHSHSHSQWNTINALTLLHALLRPFQYFLDPKVAKEPVPMQLDQIAKEILVPLLTVFHQFVQKDIKINTTSRMETEKTLLIICKCMYFAVRSHLPSSLAPLLPSFCHDLIHILGSLSFDYMATIENEYLMRLKTGKRSLQIFCALVTRHHKYSDKLMPDMINSALNIVKYTKNISKLDFLSERIVSLAFDVISRVLATGLGWRLVAPHFSLLLDSAIFPALVMNEKDISEWEEDADEFLRKNLPSDLDEVSGWKDDLFTARKSATNLLGVIAMSKGPPVGTSASSKRKKGEKNKGKNQRCSIGELLVLPFLSKFPIPSKTNGTETRILNNLSCNFFPFSSSFLLLIKIVVILDDIILIFSLFYCGYHGSYFGVLMGYGSLLDFLREQEPRHITTLVQLRLLPLYKSSVCLPYLVAPANWVLGELASCLPEEISADIYSSLLNALIMPDNGDTSCYPVRASAAGAISELLENDYLPPDWLPLLQVVIGRIGNDDEDNSILFQLLSSVVEAGNENVAVHIPFLVSSLVGAISKCIPANLEPWPQMVEKGFAALAVMAQSWENFLSEESEEDTSEKWASGRAAVGGAFSVLLQQAWLTPTPPLKGEASPSCCIDDASTLLRSIMLSVTESNVILELKIPELLLVWADLVAGWHAWEESEDMSIFDCIQEVVSLQNKYRLREFIARPMPSTPNPPVPKGSIIEGIGAFVSEAISQYPSAMWRACSCVHMLLNVPIDSFETESVKQSLAITFSRVAFSRFKEIRNKPCSLWKPLLLAVTSCYLCCPDVIERILDKDDDSGFTIWASTLSYVCTRSYEAGLKMESEIRLIVMALAKIVERHLELGKPQDGLLKECFSSLMEASVRLKEILEENAKVEEDEDDEEVETDDGDDGTEDDDEDSEADEHEETEEEFLNRYAKVAVSLQDGTVIEEEDVEDQEDEIELGYLEDIDLQRVVVSLFERYHRILIQGKTIRAELIASFLDAFPELNLYFQESRQSRKGDYGLIMIEANENDQITSNIEEFAGATWHLVWL